VLAFGEYTSGAEGNYLLLSLVLEPAPHLKIVTETHVMALPSDG